MYRHLLAPYKSDLALCFGESDDKSASLYDRANYVWDIPEYENWRDYFSQYFPEDFDQIFVDSKVTGIMGGIDDARGSGAIIFAFRDFLLRNKSKILLEYDRIILTRSDHYYLQDHPLFAFGKLPFWWKEKIVVGSRIGITFLIRACSRMFWEFAIFMCARENFSRI